MNLTKDYVKKTPALVSEMEWMQIEHMLAHWPVCKGSLQPAAAAYIGELRRLGNAPLDYRKYLGRDRNLSVRRRRAINVRLEAFGVNLRLRKHSCDYDSCDFVLVRINA